MTLPKPLTGAALALPPLVLAAVDVSSAADAIIKQAALLSTSMPGASLHIVHVVDFAPVAVGGALLLPGSAETMKRAWQHVERLCNAAQYRGAVAVGHVALGDPRAQILGLAADLSADVLVIGTHDPGKARRLFFGAIAEELVRKAPCQVFVVRPKQTPRPGEPEILPPCPDCLEARTRSGGDLFWCERHSQQHRPLAAYHVRPEPFGMGSMSFRS